MKALVISGGGSKGAYAGGISEYLIREAGRKYKVFVGTSTGSLLIPLLAAGEIDRIRKVYTNVEQSDIFNKCPLLVRKTPGGYKVGIRHRIVIGQFMRRKKTFGESENLRKLIRSTLSPSIFERLRSNSEYVIVTVANLTTNVVEHKYARDCSYDEFCDWVWASSNIVPFMSLVVRNGYEYADGGFGNLVPIQEAISIGATDIDVIVLHPRHSEVTFPRSTNAFNLLVRGFNFMLHQLGQDDIKMSLLESRYSGIRINLIHTPRVLIDNSIIFEPELMRRWWQEGYDYASTLYPTEVGDQS